MHKYIIKHKKEFICTICTSIASGLVPLYLAYVISIISDVAFNAHYEKIQYCVFSCILFLLYSFVSTSINSIMKAKYRKVLKQDLSQDVYTSLMKMDYINFKKGKVGDYLSLFTNDIKMVDEYYFFPLLSMIVDSIVSILVLIYVMRISMMCALMMVLIASATLFVPKIMENRLKRASNQLSTYAGEYNSKLKEIFQNYEVLHDFGVVSHFIAYGKSIISNMEKKQQDVNTTVSLTGNWSNCIAATFQLIFMLVIGLLILYGKMDKIYIMSIVNISNNFISNICDISNDLAGFKSVKDINQKLLNRICESKHKSQSFDYVGNISFQDVMFGYENEMVLNHFSFEFEKEKKYAIVGESGSGKSTILKLILGYYSIQSGELNSYDLNSLSVIHQESHIFNDTLRNNLTLGMDIKDSTLLDCLRIVGLQDIGLDEEIHEEGSNFSGGQLQRICIARTLTHLKPILLCDEITSSLDNQMAIQIEKQILKLKDETVLYVTHKLFDETLKNFDCILVMKKGQLVECGCYEELMKKRGAFYALKNVD